MEDEAALPHQDITTHESPTVDSLSTAALLLAISEEDEGAVFNAPVTIPQQHNSAVVPPYSTKRLDEDALEERMGINNVSNCSTSVCTSNSPMGHTDAALRGRTTSTAAPTQPPLPPSRPTIDPLTDISNNIYASIMGPPLHAKPIFFRRFLNQKQVPSRIEAEESAGVFVGQLPSSYSEDDIEAMLKALGRERGQFVQVRDVKCHNRDRTCAFIMINAGALASVLTFSKCVLCDINCVYEVASSLAPQLPLYVQQLPRDQLRGVPKAALVLEKLTPQTKSRNNNNNSNSYGNNATSHPNTRMPNPVAPAHTPPYPAGMKAVPQPFYFGHPPPTFVDGSALYSTPSMPPAMGFSFLSAATNPYFQGAALAPPMYQIPSIASVEMANQAILAAAWSRRRSGVAEVNQPRLVPTASATTRLPTAISLPLMLQSAMCSCGQPLHLSQFPQVGRCCSCDGNIEANSIAYSCPTAHVAVCTTCAMKTVNADSPPTRGAANSNSNSGNNLGNSANFHALELTKPSCGVMPTVPCSEFNNADMNALN